MSDRKIVTKYMGKGEVEKLVMEFLIKNNPELQPIEEVHHTGFGPTCSGGAFCPSFSMQFYSDRKFERKNG